MKQQRLHEHFGFKAKMQAWFSIAFMLLCIQAGSQTYELVWADEFNGTGAPDPAKWGYELGYIRNNELQYYTNSTKNVKQNNGSLEITVIKENVGGKQYTSGSIITLGKASWTYGKIEGRFKMPKGKGLWACFWTLGSNFPQIGWPKCGEIDIFEHVNSETVIHSTTHWAGANDVHVSATKSYTVDVTQWHTYAITWDANYIRWFVDGYEFHKFRITSGYNYTDEYHLPQYILINLPIGGTWPGPPDATTVLPATMYCDYVRVYKNTSTTPIRVTGFSVSPTSMTLATGGKQVVNTTFVPENATNQTVTWTSGNTSVATVNKWGLVTAVGAGTTTIRGVTADGAKAATCSVTVQNLVGVNKLVNGNFEANTTATQTPTGWTEWGSVANAQTSESNPHSPKFKGTQWGTTSFEVAVYQSLTGLVNGTYTLKAWVRSSGGQTYANMYAKGYGGSDLNYSIASSIANWTQIQIGNIKVTNNKCEVGFYQLSGSANKWVDYDDVEFYMSSVNTAGASLKSADSPEIQLSVIEEERGSSFSLFPNPLKQGNLLNIKSTGLGVFDVNIINATGQIVYCRPNNQGDLVNIDLPVLGVGVYFVKLSNSQINKIQKLLIEE